MNSIFFSLITADETNSRVGATNSNALNTMLLWDETRRLPKERLKRVEDVYR